jgi:ornithine cyclodeaminase/alanine dehydrogenase-like protein (mu-crystallin family)
VRVISSRDLRDLVPMGDAIAAVRQAFIELSAGRAVVPLRGHVPIASQEAALLAMPGYLPAQHGLGAKLVSVFPRNPSRGLPTIFATVVLLDAETGEPAALVEGTYLTALRTGAAGGVAADLLARRDAGIVALFGAGAQGRTQLEAVCAVRPVTQIRVVDARAGAAEAFVAWAREQPWRREATVLAVPEAEMAIRGAEIVLTATTSATPVFPDVVAPGAHITAIGAYTPQAREIPGTVVSRAAVFVDHRAAAVAEAGDLVLAARDGLFALDAVRAEIGEVAAGTAPGRTHDDEITLFKSVGHAVQDLAVARLALARAEAAGRGQHVELKELPQD